MCIDLEKNTKLHKTYKNHTVYKILYRRHNGLFSPYFTNFQWELGKIHTQTICTSFDCIPDKKLPLMPSFLYYTTSGLYCYRSLKKAKEFVNFKNEANNFGTYVIVTCIIPKGSYYYEEKGQICTNNLKPIKIL